MHTQEDTTGSGMHLHAVLWFSDICCFTHEAVGDQLSHSPRKKNRESKTKLVEGRVLMMLMMMMISKQDEDFKKRKRMVLFFRESKSSLFCKMHIQVYIDTRIFFFSLKNAHTHANNNTAPPLLAHISSPIAHPHWPHT